MWGFQKAPTDLAGGAQRGSYSLFFQSCIGLLLFPSWVREVTKKAGVLSGLQVRSRTSTPGLAMCGLNPGQLWSLAPSFPSWDWLAILLGDTAPRTGLYSCFSCMDPDGYPHLLLTPQLQAAAHPPYASLSLSLSQSVFRVSLSLESWWLE